MNGVRVGLAFGFGLFFSITAQAQNLIPPSTIKVLRTATGQIEIVDFKTYVKNVLPNEWIAIWDMEALRAGAMAVKTYAWYWIINRKYPGQGFDIKDTTADQVYKPGSSHPRTDRAVEETWHLVMTRGKQIFQAQYFDGTPGLPETCSVKTGRCYAGRMSQWGTQHWARQGRDWQWIFRYYYGEVGAQ